MRVAGCWVPSDTLWLGAGPRWATVASEWGQMSLFRSPSPFGSEARGPSSKRRSVATQPSRRARTY